MRAHSVLSVIASAIVLAAALPADNAAAGLRLIKISEEDPGTWVTDEQKINEYTSKGIHFIDITDITDQDVLQRLSTKPGSGATWKRAVDYPSVVSHQSEANALIADANTDGPESWLKTMTE